MGLNTSYSGVAMEDLDSKSHKSFQKRHDASSVHGEGAARSWRRHFRRKVTDTRQLKRQSTKLLVRLRHFWPTLPISGLIIAIVLLVKLPLFLYSGSICPVDGAFSLGFQILADYDPWATSEAFTINLASGPIPFATAKLADISWDVGIGRGIQTLLAIISYKVCTKALARIMQAEPVTQATFEAITLRGDSYLALAFLIKDYTKNGSFRARITILWIIISTLLLLVFPTLASAMTGYSATLDSYIQPNNSEAVQASNFKSVFYIIHDGSRLGSSFYDDYPIIDPRQGDPVIPDFCPISDAFVSNKFQEQQTLLRQRYMPGCASYAPQYNNSQGEQIWQQHLKQSRDCDLLWHMSEYTSNYGFLGLQNVSSTLGLSTGNVTLPSPALNITAYYSAHDDSCFNNYLSNPLNETLNDWMVFPYGVTWQNTITNTTVDETPFSTESKPMFAYNGTLYTLDQMNSQGKCQQKDPLAGPISYQWGFSFQLLLACLILLLVWSVIICMLHIDAYVNLHPAVEKREMGLQRAILDLANEYNTSLTSNGDDSISPSEVYMYGNGKLKDFIDKNHTLSYNEAMAYEHGMSRYGKMQNWMRQGGKEKLFSGAWFRHESFKTWFRTERFWLLSLGIFFLLAILGPFFGVIMYIWSPDVSFLPVLGNLLALAAARRKRVRGWIMAITFTIFLSVEIWWAYENWQCITSWTWGFVPPSEYIYQFCTTS